jgi:HEAT repeat protein
MNKRVLLFAVFTGLPLLGQPQQIQSLLAKIATYQYGGDPAPAIQLEELVGKQSGSAESKKMIEPLLLKFLQSEATPAGKEAGFRALSLVGSNAAIPVLAPLLTQVDTAEMARYALAAIPGPAVDEALRKGLAAAPSDRIKVGLINSLGRRRDAKSVQAIAPLIVSRNPEVTAAAAAALASISDRAAMDALAAARKNSSGQIRELVSQAYVVGADHAAARGDKIRAAAVYKDLSAPTELSTVRARAFKGLAAADPKSGIAALIAEIKSDDAERQVIGIRLISGIQGSEVTKALVSEFPTLTPVGQVHALTALASRGDASARPVVAAALKSTESAIRAAALSALGQLGDELSVKMLAEAAATGKEPELSAARRSLYSLRGANIDSAITGAIGSATGKVKSELIVAAGERAVTGAATALTTAARDTDPDVRREALRALRNVGGAAQTQALLDLLLKSSTSSERRDATQTLAAVLRRAQPAPVAPVVSAYRATPAKEARLSLLEVMGQTSNTEVLPVLREGIKDPDPEIARGAILALTAWDDPTPLPDLLNLAKGTARSVPGEPPPAVTGFGRGNPPPTNNLQILALRGVLRLVTLPSKRSASENGLLLSDAMRLASQTPEKRTILSLLPSFPSKESLGVARAAVTDQAVTTEAKIAVDQVADALKLK